MRISKIVAPLLFVLSAACSERSLDKDIIRVFERHGYREYPPASVADLLRSKGYAGLRSLDQHAEVVTARKKLKPLPGGLDLSSGLLFEERGGGVFLAKVFSGSPAFRAGLRNGDRVLEINGAAASPGSVAGGAAGGGGLKLKVVRRAPGGPVATSAEVKREPFSFPTIFGFYEPEKHTAFVRIGMLYEGSGATVLSGLRAFSRLEAKKIVFDLRDCGGGVPDEAAALLRAFAPKAGPVFVIGSRHKGYSRTFEAAARGAYSHLEVSVLVNSGTAMAAEVFAAALKELNGAAIMGEPTKGDVSLKKTFALGRGAKGLTLTIARMLPPSGLDLEEKGLVPDLDPGLSRETKAAVRTAWADSSETVLLTDPAYKKALETLDK